MGSMMPYRDLCAKSIFGLFKWMLLRERVGYECRLLLYEKKLLNTGGSNSFLYLYMNIAICRVFMSCILKTFNRWNKGFVWDRYVELVQILTAFFCIKRM